ncbi:hypothetical protein [Halobacillus litoralis]|uniref:hypothetical protein n=1 Tax=Halobacillus litoralis TaxID=45668 RepID=UPI002491F03D|nr:hypothetical protein [Halobacillus litoralis]
MNVLKNNSGIFVGPNTQNQWDTHEKHNAALGTVVGEANILAYNINVIHDEDMVDMPIRKENGGSKHKKENGGGHSSD